MTHLMVLAQVSTAEESLADQLRIMVALIDHVGEAVYVTNAHQIITFWSRGAERLYGWTIDEAIGAPVQELVFRQQPERASEIRAALESGGEWNGECNHTTKNGTTLTVECRCSLLVGPRGDRGSVLAVNSDLSDKRNTEIRLRRAQQLESIGTLACGVAHDLNNILAGLSIAVDLLRSKDSSAEMQEFLQALQGSTRRASEMIRQMLSFSKGIQGNTIQMNLGSLAKEISRICQATFPSTIRFRTKIAPDLWDVVGNATTLHQALLNLATNARDAMPHGGVLSISLENTELDEAFAHGEPGIKPGPFVRLQVQDTGVGIPIDVLEHIFDPFFTTKGPEKGSGLGLTMVQKTVREHGGIIRCESQAGQGACFSIYLPASAANPKAAIQHDPANVFVGHGQSVLLVDADPPTRNLLKAVLEMFNLRVYIAGDGVEALTAFTEIPEAIWVVISEMRLQHIDGLQLIRAIHSIAPNVPVVALIDSGDSARQADLDNLNVRRFLHKPFTAEDVAAVLNTIPEVNLSPTPSAQAALGFLSILPKIST
jgi:PAS domain S-box-containing protein